MKPAQRIKSEDETAEETEFYRRMNMSPYVNVRRIVTNGSCYDVILTIGSKDIGRKTEIMKRGKVTLVHYFLPNLEASLQK